MIKRPNEITKRPNNGVTRTIRSSIKRPNSPGQRPMTKRSNDSNTGRKVGTRAAKSRMIKRPNYLKVEYV